MGPEGPRTLAKALHDTLMLFSRGALADTLISGEKHTNAIFPLPGTLARIARRGQNKL